LPTTFAMAPTLPLALVARWSLTRSWSMPRAMISTYSQPARQSTKDIPSPWWPRTSTEITVPRGRPTTLGPTNTQGLWRLLRLLPQAHSDLSHHKLRIRAAWRQLSQLYRANTLLSSRQTQLREAPDQLTCPVFRSS